MPDPAPLVVVGDALLDRDVSGTAQRLAPDAPVPVVEGCEERIRPGGAALAALLAARDGRHVTLVTALGDDPASHTLRSLLDGHVTVVALPLDGTLPEKTRVLAQGRPLTRLDQGDGRAAGGIPDAARAALAGARTLLVADYARGTADALRDALADAAHRTPLVWDPHPRGGPPVPGTRLATPTAAEALTFARALATEDDTPGEGDPHGLRRTARTARALADAWGVASVAVTLGERGALLTQGGSPCSPLLVPAPEAHERDSCGAGDRFAATAAGLLADGALPEEAVRAAVLAATAYVAHGGAAALAREVPRDTPHVPARTRPRTATRDTAPETAPEHPDGDPRAATGDAQQVIARVRAQGGTVVATGGCFDLLHAGHIGLLQAARRTGDCLIVCLNSDTSVRRRKGEGRPINPLQDRLRVLRALEGVDAVAVFDEDTPERLLSRLRPDIWVKGGDYALAELPETAQLEQWGGQAILLPYLDGRSTSRLAARMQGDRT